MACGGSRIAGPLLALSDLRGDGLVVADSAIHKARTRSGVSVALGTGCVQIRNLFVFRLSFDIQKGFGQTFLCFPVAERTFSIGAFHVLHMLVMREKDRRHFLCRQRGKGEGNALFPSGRGGEKGDAGEKLKAEQGGPESEYYVTHVTSLIPGEIPACLDA